MAVTTTYDFDVGITFETRGDAGTDFTNLDLVSLAGGGFAVGGTHYGTHTDVFIYDEDLAITADAFSVISYGSAPTALAQLHNTNIVNVYQVGGDIQFAILRTDGTEAHAASGLGFAPTFGAVAPENADVAGLTGGGFAVALDNTYSAGDHDIYVMLRHPNGSADTTIEVAFTGDDDTAPSIAGLNDGGFAVAWTRTDSGNTEVWEAVYNADGTERLGATLVDTTGTINRDVAVVALADGGFGLLYEDNGWLDTGLNITYAQFDASGTFLDFNNVTSTTSYDCSQASGTVLGNGYLAVSYTKDFGGDTDIVVQVVDPVTGDLLGGFQSADFDFNDSAHSSIASLGLGGLVTGWVDNVQGDQAVDMQFQRTSTGDAGNNRITGDNLMDIMYGGVGRDILKGLGNDDTLNGETERDKIVGGFGQDSLTGGTSADQFAFRTLADSTITAPDTIFDLADNDKINLRAIDADSTHNHNQAFHLVGVFTGHPAEAELVFHTVGIYAGNTTLELDVNGDTVADMLVLIVGDHHTFTNFIL